MFICDFVKINIKKWFVLFEDTLSQKVLGNCFKSTTATLVSEIRTVARWILLIVGSSIVRNWWGGILSWHGASVTFREGRKLICITEMVGGADSCA